LKNYFIEPTNNLFNSDSLHFGVKQYKIRIEEMEDLLTQFKIKSQPHKLIELEELVVSLREKLNEKEKIVGELSQKLKDAINKSTYIFDERQAISSLSTAMKEKDMIIYNLKNELKSVIKDCETKKFDNNINSIKAIEPSNI
jgi:hypothetical protein